MNNNISFGIYANQTDKRWNTFIEEMKTFVNFRLNDAYPNKYYYGIDINGEFQAWIMK